MGNRFLDRQKKKKKKNMDNIKALHAREHWICGHKSTVIVSWSAPPSRVGVNDFMLHSEAPADITWGIESCTGGVEDIDPAIIRRTF